MNELKKLVDNTNINIYQPNLYFDHDEARIMKRLRQIFIIDGIANYELAMYLYRVREEVLWQTPGFSLKSEPYLNFYTWAFSELSLGRRKVQYLLFIASKLIQSNPDVETIKMLFALGWSKAFQVLRLAQSQEDILRLVETVEHMTEKEIFGMVNIQLAINTKVEMPVEVPVDIPKLTTKTESISESDIYPESEIKTTSGDVIDVPLAEKIILSVAFKHSDNYILYQRAMARIQKKIGAGGDDHVIGILSAHYLSSSFVGHNEEMPSELEARLKAFQAYIAKEYNIDININVNEANVDEEENDDELHYSEVKENDEDERDDEDDEDDEYDEDNEDEDDE